MMKHSSCLCMLALLALLSASAVAQEAAVAPLNPKFVEWQAGKSLGGEGFGYVPSPVDWSRSVAPAAKAVPPASFDLRTQPNGLTPVKDQSSCGACWAFAVCSAMESWERFTQGLTQDLSENNMKNHHGFLIDSCLGGNDDMATAYLVRGDGPLSEADDPYNPFGVTNPVPGAAPVSYLKAMPVFTLGAGNDRTEIQNAIMTYGALSVSMTWMDSAYNSATKTYYYNNNPGITYGHAVAVVGWDNAKTVPGAPGPGAWICKNNWSSGWGESGFFYISYYDADAVKDARAYINQVPASTYSRIYQYDTFGITGSAGSGSGNTFWGANVFTAAADGRITGIGTYAVGHATAYQITVYNSGYSNGFANPVATASGTAAQPGYFVVDLASPVDITSGQKFSVVVRYTVPNEVYPLPIEGPRSGYCNATAGTGQSYMSSGGASWTDIPAQGGSWANINACIKALVQEGPYPVELTVYGPGMVQEGDALNFRVWAKNLVGTATYQWQKDHVDIDGATEATFVIPSAIAQNTGTYNVIVTDESKAVYESDPYRVEVLPAGTLPAAGMAGMAALAAAVAVLGAKRRRG